jgi:hypothetical protein
MRVALLSHIAPTQHPTRRLYSALLLLYTLVLAEPVLARITVDGVLDESEWDNAKHCSGWQQTEPYVQGEPRYRNDAMFVATPEGLAVALVFDQPASERRTRVRTPHDGALDGDSTQVIVDFDATGQVGYEFSLGLGGGTRDGLVTNQTHFDRDWDGEWWHAIRETNDQWIAEMLIPWSSVAMKNSGSEKRELAVYVNRYLSTRNEVFACPGIPTDAPVFLSAFERIQVDQHRANGTLDIVPYASALSDFVDDHSTFRGGLDLNWKPTSNFGLTATINPDFGQVESDELVVNFSAIETALTDRRPFFTENLGVFDLRTPNDDQLIYTRRIGGPSDDGHIPAADIDAAMKVTGSSGSLVYGAFAAQEDQYSQDIGRRFVATRVAMPADRYRVGFLSTWTERPYFDRSALVNAVDYEVAATDQFRLSGQFIRSDIDQNHDSTVGYQAWLQADIGSGSLNHSLKLLHIDDRFDLNDLGYMERNSLDQIAWQTQRRVAGSAESSLSGQTQTFAGYYRENAEGDRLPGRVQFIQEAKYRNAWSSYLDARVYSSGIDDLISRGNGPVKQDPRVGFYLDTTSPRLGNFAFVLSTYTFQEGVSGFAERLSATALWYPNEQLTLRMDLFPYYENDWLLWSHDNLFGSYRARRLDYGFRLDWVPTPRHELRIKWEWIGIDAELRDAYRTTSSGHLERSDDVLPPFTVNSLGFQIRYRYKMGPLSDLYLVYARGGFQVLEDDARQVDDLFKHMVDVRDADQFLIKFRYRL